MGGLVRRGDAPGTLLWAAPSKLWASLGQQIEELMSKGPAPCNLWHALCYYVPCGLRHAMYEMLHAACGSGGHRIKCRVGGYALRLAGQLLGLLGSIAGCEQRFSYAVIPPLYRRDLQQGQVRRR
jgi:hypothetical protein